MKHMFGCGMLKSEKKHSVTKADMWFLAGILTVSLLILFFLNGRRAQGAYVGISYDGRQLGRIFLMQEEAKYYLLTEQPVQHDKAQSGKEEPQMTLQELVKDADTGWAEMIAQAEAQNQTGSYNIFMCQDGKVRMIRSSCPDLICVHHKEISAAGETIICLPHKVALAVTGSEEQGLDGVAY